MKKQNLILLFILLFSSMLTAAESGLHSTFDGLLKKYVKDGVVEYGQWKRDQKDLDTLTYYLDRLSSEIITDYPKKERLAFWINAYNAYTLKLILDHYGSIKSIKDIKNPWKRDTCKVAGKSVSLDYIEHTILRKEFKEPRIHFAIVCASIGCPKLASDVFVADKIEAQLQQRAELFFNDPKYLKAGKSWGRPVLQLSKILDWFAEDFGKTDADRIAFIKSFLTEETLAGIAPLGDTPTISFLDYNWDLNGK